MPALMALPTHRLLPMWSRGDYKSKQDGHQKHSKIKHLISNLKWAETRSVVAKTIMLYVAVNSTGKLLPATL